MTGKGKFNYKESGTLNYSNGDKYNGEWKNNMKHGNGKNIIIVRCA